MDATDEELVQRAARELPYGTAAYETLVRRYEPRVFRTCLRYLGSPQEAEEAGQDVFLRIFHALPRFEGRSRFRTWLYRITANVCATRYAKLRREFERRQSYQQHLSQLPQSTAPPQDVVDFEGPLGEALDALLPGDRQILILRHISELSFAEIAETLQISLSAAKMRVYRAEERLRARYPGAVEESQGGLWLSSQPPESNSLDEQEET